MEAGDHQEGAASSSSSSSKTSGSSTTSSSTTSFTSALTLSQLGDAHVPQRYVLPPPQRPINPSYPNLSTLPILDLSSLQSSSLRPHVINHGIPLSVMKDALSAAKEFFNLPVEDKILLGSDNVHAPVRYGTSINHAVDKVMAVNCYPKCPEPELALGMPSQSDYGSITILLQSCPGLQIMDQNKNWISVPDIEGALLVQMGDQMEVLSNGQYKSVVHRVTVSDENNRLSIASLHSLSLDKKIEPAPMLVDSEHPKSYKEFSFRDFLDYITSNDIVKGRYIDTLKENP
ncbi:hypothetical protein ACLB2K_072401 [Fragaria x ananassa]